MSEGDGAPERSVHSGSVAERRTDMSRWQAALRRTLAVSLALLPLASAAKETSPQISSGLTQVRTEAVRVREQVSNAALAARRLASSRRSNVPNSLASFSKSLAELKSSLAGGREAVRAVEDQSAAYFTKWDEQLRGMSQDLQKSGQKRKAETVASFDAVRGDLAEVRTSLKPFVDELSEVEKYLQMDQTAAGLNTVSSRLTSTADRWPVIRRDLDRLIQRIDAVQR
jgi:hypothetical protein